jgi:hypothetical protein
MLVAMAGAGPEALAQQPAPCTCRAMGQDVPLGQTVCLQTPAGARRATCEMVLNNTSWTISTDACETSEDDRGQSPLKTASIPR